MSKHTTPDKGKKLSKKEFVLRAITRLRDTEKSKGIHTVYRGFNDAFKKYFPGENPVDCVRQLIDEGVITGRPVKGGFMIYDASDPYVYDPEKKKQAKADKKADRTVAAITAEE